MRDWLTVPEAGAPAVLVTVARVEGSAPREAGACMLVMLDAQFDTIGGGHLEHRALEIARGMIQNLTPGADPRGLTRNLTPGSDPRGLTLTGGGRGPGSDPSGLTPGLGLVPGGQTPGTALYERFALGPSLGQCCGGVVWLSFEHVAGDLAQVLHTLRSRRHADSWRYASLDANGPAAAGLLDAAGRHLAGVPPPQGLPLPGQPLPGQPLPGQPAGLPAGLPQPAPGSPTATLARTTVSPDSTGAPWLVTPIRAPRTHLVLFGAGHVGAAIVRALAELPCTVTWVDEREDMFPPIRQQNVTTEATDTPEACVANAPAGASYLVMTHSHALDQRLAEAILRRADAGWFGMIGSDTKRAQFSKRLEAKGLDPARMVCPVGLPGIINKAPAAIAASVAAQLLMVWEDQDLRKD